MSRTHFVGRARRLLPVALGLALLAALVVAAGVGYVEWRGSQPVSLPEPTGPFAVGRTTFDWTDQARPDPLNPGGGAKRELVVWVWYPADPAPGAQPAPYLPEPWARALEAQRVAGAGLIAQRFDAVLAHAVEDAPVATAQATYPVLVFEPGFGSIPPNYTVLADELASHGYVVAGVTPTGSAPVVVFADGRTAGRTELGNVPDDADAAAMRRRADALIAVWSADARFVLDRLAALDAGTGGPLAGRLDLGRVGVFGHSFGGATAAEVCRQDIRCRAGADLDGTPYGPVAELGLRQPFLFVLEDRSGPCDAECQDGEAVQARLFAGLPDADEVTIAGTRHFDFTDYAVLFSPLHRLMGLLGPIDGRRGLAVTGAYLRAFFDHELLDRPAPLLDGPSAEYPEATLRRR